MKRTNLHLTCAFAALLCIPLLGSCGESHHYASEWTHDEENHWHACTDEGFKDLKSGVEPHVYTEVTTSQTADENGYVTHTCNVCGYSYITELDYVNDQGLSFLLQDDGTYAVSVGTARLLSKIRIPERYNGKAVTAIAESGFASCENLTSIALPSTITTLGVAAFSTCKNLTSIVLPSAITRIENSTFHSCYKLQSISLPESLTYLGEDAFCECYGLKDVAIPQGVSEIGARAFRDCRFLERIKLGEAVTRIGNDAFLNCVKLNAVDYVVSDMGKFAQMSGKSNLFVNNSLEVKLFDQQGKEIVDVVVPEGTKTLADHAFRNAIDVVSLSLPDSLETIGHRAFLRCASLKSIRIPSNVSAIPDGEVFDRCEALTAIDVASGNSHYVSKEGILFTQGMTKLIRCPSQKSGEVIVPNTVTEVSSFAFAECKEVTAIVLPDTVTSIGASAFYSCSKMARLRLPDNDTRFSFGDWMFTNCYALTSLELPKNTRSIGYGAMGACSSLTSIVIPNTVNFVGADVFAYCTRLQTVFMPFGLSSVSGQGYTAPTWFSNCSALQEVYFTNNVAGWIEEYVNLFSNYSGVTFYVYSQNRPSNPIPEFKYYYLDEGNNRVEWPAS